MDVLRMNDFLVCADGDVFPDGAIINADSKLLDKQIDEYKKKSNSKNQEASIMWLLGTLVPKKIRALQTFYPA